MADNLKILISAMLNENLSKVQIQSQLDKLAKGLKLNVGIDTQQLKELDSTVKKIQNQIGGKKAKIIDDNESKSAKEIYTSIEQAVSAYKKLGTVKISRDFIDPATKELQQFTLAVTKGEGEVDKFKFKLASLTNIQGLPSGSFIPIKESSVDNTQAINIKQTQQLTAEKERLRQELVRLGQTGNVTAQQLANVARSVNGVKDTSGLQQAQAAFTQLQSQAKLAEQMSQGREKAEVNRQQAENKANVAQAQAINRNNELTRQQIQQGKELEAEIKRRLELYQKEKQIQAANLQAKYGSSLNQGALNSQLSNVMNASASQFKSLAELKNFTQQANVGFKELSSGIQTASHHAMSFGDSLKMAFSRMGMMMGVSTVIFQSITALSNGIKVVNDLNKSLTEVSIVTGKNQEQVAQLGQEYNKLAKGMGVTTTELSQTAASLYRQGLSDDEVKSRMKTITEYAKISSLDVQTATEIMTASINSMGVSATRASDVFSYLGDATATGADEIGRAMQKVGGSAGALQIPFEKVSSWVSIVSSRTREGAETIGQSIKGILARIQNMKEKGFDEEDGTQVNQVAKALSAVGIALMDNEGQFRNFGTVMDELGAKWDTLDSRQKAYISTTVNLAAA